MACFWRPKIFTMLCPVYISSTWPLRVPVRSHCSANCFCERLAISMATTADTGECDERDHRQQRADPEHHGQHADQGEERR